MKLFLAQIMHLGSSQAPEKSLKGMMWVKLRHREILADLTQRQIHFSDADKLGVDEGATL